MGRARRPIRFLGRATFALGSALLLLSVTVPVHAVVVPRPIEVLSGPEIPANGVLLFRGASSDDLLVSDEGDVTVSGAFGPLTLDGIADFSIFRADEDLALGAYIWQTEPRIASGAFTALPLYEPAEHELEVELSLGEIWVQEGSLCCDPDPTTGIGTCVPKEKAQRYSVELTVRSPLPPEHARQYLYRASAFPAFDAAPPADHVLRLNPSVRWADLARFTSGTTQTAALAPAAEYCIELEAMSLIDESVFTTRRCIADPGTELATLPLSDDEYLRDFQFQGCPDPDPTNEPSSELGEGGCACRAAPSASPHWLIVPGLAALVLLQFRRRGRASPSSSGARRN
jgi:hypothetical protein